MTKKPTIKYKLYILMRNDLPSMNAGKAMAQAAHAANNLIGQWGLNRNVVEWQKEAVNFGTTIVLSVTKEQLILALKKAQMRDMPPPFGPVWDDTYPYNTTTEIAALIPKKVHTAPPIVREDNRVMLFRRELTCGYVLVAEGSSDWMDIVGEYPLHP